MTSYPTWFLSHHLGCHNRCDIPSCFHQSGIVMYSFCPGFVFVATSAYSCALWWSFGVGRGSASCVYFVKSLFLHVINCLLLSIIFSFSSLPCEWGSGSGMSCCLSRAVQGFIRCGRCSDFCLFRGWRFDVAVPVFCVVLPLSLWSSIAVGLFLVRMSLSSAGCLGIAHYVSRLWQWRDVRDCSDLVMKV